MPTPDERIEEAIQQIEEGIAELKDALREKLFSLNSVDDTFQKCKPAETYLNHMSSGVSGVKKLVESLP